MDIIDISVAKKYTDGSIEGIVGSLAGKPCQIQSITPITGGNRVTYLWEDNSGDSHTSTMDVMDGVDGEVPAETLLKDTVGWTGKNVFNLIATSKTDEYGLTWTVNANNTITVSGTPTDFKAYYIRHDGTLPAGQYIFSGWGDATNITVNSGFLRKGNTEVRKILNGNLSDPQTIEILDSDAGTYDNILISLKRIENNVACSGTVYPMLRKAEISDPTFEPYHEDVVDTLRDAEVIEGKNIIPFPYYSQIDGNKAGTIEPTVNSDGSITFSAGTSSAGSKYYYLISRFDSHFTVPAGRYWCSGIPSDTPEGITMLFGCTRNGEGYSYNTLSAGDAKVGNVKVGDELGLTIIINPNTTISSPITFYPMICTEADWKKSHDYKPYYVPLKDKVEEISDRVPTAPTTDGTYSLKVTVASGTPTYSWVSD